MIEDLIRKENFISRINGFFRANGPTRIFIFCEKLNPAKRPSPEDAAALSKKNCSANDDVALRVARRRESRRREATPSRVRDAC